MSIFKITDVQSVYTRVCWLLDKADITYGVYIFFLNNCHVWQLLQSDSSSEYTVVSNIFAFPR